MLISQNPKWYIHFLWIMGHGSYAFSVLQTCGNKFFSLTQINTIGTDKICNCLENIELAGRCAGHSYGSLRLVKTITQSRSYNEEEKTKIMAYFVHFLTQLAGRQLRVTIYFGSLA